jgi:hypothetical protein
MKKGSLIIAIGKMKPKGMKDAPDSDHYDSESEDMDAGLESAFDDLIEALGVDPEKVDHKAGIEALKSFFGQCDEEEDDEDDKDEDEEDEDSEDDSEKDDKHSDSGF